MTRARERGIALLIVITMVALLTVLVVELVLMAGNQRLAADMTLADLQISYALRSGYYRARLYLEADTESGGGADHLHERWAESLAFTVGDAQVLVEIRDAERGINVSRLIEQDGDPCGRVRGILAELGAMQGLDPAVPEALIDYMDPDTIGTYETGAHDALLYHPEEVLRIDGVERDQWVGEVEETGTTPGYLDFITIWPREASEACPGEAEAGPCDMKVNLNTAPREVLAALFSPPNSAYADMMIQWRDTVLGDGSHQVFQSAADVTSAIGDAAAAAFIQGVSVYSSSIFVIRVKARSGSVEEGHVFVVKRGDEGTIELLTHYRLPDAIYTSAPD